MSSHHLRLVCIGLVAVAATALTGGVWGADEFVAPPKAEREAVAALRAKGAILQVDGNYRVYSVVMLTNCTNDDLKLLPALERLTNLQLQSSRFTDEGIEHLKPLSGLTTLIVAPSISEAGIASIKAALPSARVTAMRSGFSTTPSG